jgi:hypothetical protein
MLRAGDETVSLKDVTPADSAVACILCEPVCYVIFYPDSADVPAFSLRTRFSRAVSLSALALGSAQVPAYPLS